MPRKATVRARGLGAELKEMRVRSGMSTTKVGERLGWSASTVSRIETGKRGVTTEEVAAMMVVYKASPEERRRLIELAREAHRSGWWESRDSSLPSQLTALINFESQATIITDVAMVLIPGLLQTADYTRAIMTKGDVPAPLVEARVAARQGRQTLLAQRNGPQLEPFIDEAALRRPIGRRQVMADQIHRLIEVSRHPRVRLRVLPLASYGHPALDGSFTLLRFEKAPALVHLESLCSSLFLDQPDDINTYLAAVNNLGDIALDTPESVDLLTDVAQSYEDQ